MHELSIVQSILEIADSEVRKVQAHKVDQIDLDIGRLAGIEMDALYFAWDACVPETVLADAKRVVHHIPAKARCSDCAVEFETADYFAQCPNCDEYMTELIQGQELIVRQLLVS